MTEFDPVLEAVVDALDNEYTKDELLAYADEFGVEVKSSQRKEAIARAYAELGITVELIKGLTPDPVEDEEEPVVEELTAADTTPPVEDDEELHLVRMTRPNHSYEVRGHKYTQDHPFAVVDEETADYLIEVDGGFRMATPKEARAYYS